MIEGSTDTVISQMEQYISSSGKLKSVTVFFDNCNFLITKYELLSPSVHMVLEFEKREIQIEGINCGYVGGGPNTSIRLMKKLGLPKQQIEPLFHGNRAISFAVDGEEIYNLCTYQLFCEKQPCSLKNELVTNCIRLTNDVSVLLDEKLVRLYNPQRTNWRGFINLMGYMKNIQMEYYIGNSSPLDGRIYLGTGAFGTFRQGMDNVDLDGIQHCNLYLSGDNFNISCLIDRNCEKEVIEAVYLTLTGKILRLDKKISKYDWIRKIFHRAPKTEIHERIKVDDAGKRE